MGERKEREHTSAGVTDASESHPFEGLQQPAAVHGADAAIAGAQLLTASQRSISGANEKATPANRRRARIASESLWLAAFLFALAAFITLASAVLIPHRTDYGSNWGAYLAENPDSLDAIAFGSSVAYCDISPAAIFELTGISSYVMAGPEQTLPLTYYYVKEAFKTQTPTLAIIDVTGTFFPGHTSYDKANIGYMPWSFDRLAATFTIAHPNERLGLIFPLYNYHSLWEDPSFDNLSYGADMMAGFTPLAEAPAAEAAGEDAGTATGEGAGAAANATTGGGASAGEGAGEAADGAADGGTGALPANGGRGASAGEDADEASGPWALAERPVESDEDAYEASLRALGAIAALCRDEGATALFFTAPTLRPWEAARQSALEEALRGIEGAHYINFNDTGMGVFMDAGSDSGTSAGSGSGSGSGAGAGAGSGSGSGSGTSPEQGAGSGAEDGIVPTLDFYDPLHLNASGAQKFAKPLSEAMADLVGERKTVDAALWEQRVIAFRAFLDDGKAPSG